MDTFIWIAAGATIGWIAFTALHVNLSRGLVLSIIIGALTAYIGGSFLAPFFAAPDAVEAGKFNGFPLVMAAASAAACLWISDQIYERFGV